MGPSNTQYRSSASTAWAGSSLIAPARSMRSIPRPSGPRDRRVEDRCKGVSSAVRQAQAASQARSARSAPRGRRGQPLCVRNSPSSCDRPSNLVYAHQQTQMASYPPDHAASAPRRDRQRGLDALRWDLPKRDQWRRWLSALSSGLCQGWTNLHVLPIRNDSTHCPIATQHVFLLGVSEKSVRDPRVRRRANRSSDPMTSHA